MTRIKNTSLAALAFLLLPMAAKAAPIEGQLGMSGSLAPTCSVDPAPNPCTIDIADGLTFADSGAGNEFLTTFATGDFADDGLGFGDIGSIFDFMFNPLGPSQSVLLWTISGISFDWSFSLESVSVESQTSFFVDLKGEGTLSSTGYDDTMGVWALSTDSTNNNLTLSWSSWTLNTEVSDTEVPEPATLEPFLASV